MTEALPTISLVTCSFQHARFLDATIRSVLAQNYPALDYRVMDGGSSDGSTRIIRKYAHMLAHWQSRKDAGQTDALIQGFNGARGDIFGWLCSDDLLLPRALLRVGRFFRDHTEVNAVYGDALWIDVNGEPIRTKREMPFSRFVFLHDHNYVPQPAMFWRRSLYERVGGLRSDFDLAMDTDLWERFSAQGQIAHMPEYLACMRFYPQQKTRDGALKNRGQKEDEEVAARSGVLRSAPPLRPLLQPVLRSTARLARVIQKAAAGGYMQPIPDELRPWLAAHGTPDYNFSTSTGFMPADSTCPPDTVEEVASIVRTRV